jgi:hypothetical protein
MHLSGMRLWGRNASPKIWLPPRVCGKPLIFREFPFPGGSQGSEEPQHGLVRDRHGRRPASPTAAIDRYQALRSFLTALIDKGGGWAHPVIWAPFVVVGEGSNDDVRSCDPEPT